VQEENDQRVITLLKWRLGQIRRVEEGVEEVHQEGCCASRLPTIPDRSGTECVCRTNTISVGKTSNPNHPLNNLPSHRSKLNLTAPSRSLGDTNSR